MSTSDAIALVNITLTCGLLYFMGQVWQAINTLKKSTEALTQELEDQGLIPPRKPNGAGRRRGTYV